MDALLKKQFKRFRKNRRGWWSFQILTILFALSLFSEAICDNRPYIIHYHGHFTFPLLHFYPGTVYDEDEPTEIDYKEFTESEHFKKPGNWAIYPPIRYGSNEAMDSLPTPPPSRPTRQNLLGTDDRGRDLLTRLIYGFRNSMLFALVSWAITVGVAYVAGATQGYLGGRTDFFGQRATEIWNSLPVLYIIIFLLSIFNSSLPLLTIVYVTFAWIGLSSYVRAEVLRVRRLDYVGAAGALGATTGRILGRHVLPNTLTPIISLSPFIFSAAIEGLAALDYLGLGLPPPMASWGELLRQGKENLTCWWLVIFPFLSLFINLLLLNFIGEAVRSAFDAKE